MKHLYVHVPFCRSRCRYCDFASETAGPHQRAGRDEEYAKALLRELDERGGSHAFDTVYVGGGTPTVLHSELLIPLVRRLASRLEVDGEFTVEANPGTLGAGLSEEIRASGVTRLSLGVQSFSSEARRALGRGVSNAETESAIEAVAQTGWGEWNLDLVFGIPGQDWPKAKADIERAVALAPTHISLYDLAYTPAYEKWVDGRLGAEARRAACVMAEERYAEASGRLEAAGYRRYEVSNFALPGHECRHNRAYWAGEDYLGIGVSAVSTVGQERRTNPVKVVDYLAGRPPETERLAPLTRLWESAMLGLRTREGVDEATVEPVVAPEAVERLLAQGCLERRYGKLRLNAGFLDVSNSVIAALLVDPESLRSSTPAGDDTH